jgi:hypothetical protein
MGRGSFILGIYRADENHSEWKKSWRLANRKSHFIVVMSAPTFGGLGTGRKSGPRSLGDESGPDCIESRAGQTSILANQAIRRYKLPHNAAKAISLARTYNLSRVRFQDKPDIAVQACALSISRFLQGSDRTPARGIHSGELFALEINHSRSEPAMLANPAADFRGIDQPKNVGAERVPYPERTRFYPRRMKAEPCFVGKASPVLR